MSHAAVLPAHSLTEVSLYLEALPCPGCGSGRLQTRERTTEERHIDHVVAVTCRCDRCDLERTLRFRIDAEGCVERDPPVINHTNQPSQLLDVAQWLTLCHARMQRSTAAPDRTAGRRLAYEAGLCADEALKFYEADNDLPPESAFFDPQRRRQALAHPRQFSRQVVLDLRRRLPDSRPHGPDRPAGRRRPWWRIWE